MKNYTLKSYRTDYLKLSAIDAAEKLGLAYKQLHKWESQGVDLSLTLVSAKKIILPYGCIVTYTNEGTFLQPK